MPGFNCTSFKSFQPLLLCIQKYLLQQHVLLLITIFVFVLVPRTNYRVAYKQKNSGDLPVWEEWHCGQGPTEIQATHFSLCPYLKEIAHFSTIPLLCSQSRDERHCFSTVCGGHFKQKENQTKAQNSPKCGSKKKKKHSFTTWEP